MNIDNIINKILKYLIISCVILILIAVTVVYFRFKQQCPIWSHTNHCDALCYHKYGRSDINDYHTDKTVIEQGYGKYICICDKGNISTSETCM